MDAALNIGRERLSQYKKRLESLRSERTSFDDQWKEIGDNLLPRRTRFTTSERKTAGSKTNNKIINSTATRALRILAAGMMAGITSPARKWFRLTVPDLRLRNSASVRRWLDEVERRMLLLFSRSNVYNALPQIYLDLPAFGTAVMFLEDDPLDIIRAHVFPCGSYFLATDTAGRVIALYREIQFTVEQVVDRFGLENCSRSVRERYNSRALDDTVEVVHVIEKNDDLNLARDDAEGMEWRSCWFEKQADEGRLLAKRGFREFPVMAPRWSLIAGDSYGTSCPGMDALGDTKQLQHMEKRRAEVLDKLVRPPMKAPTSMRKKRVSILPGDVTFVDQEGNRDAFSPAYQVDARGLTIREEIAGVEQRLFSTFYADLFLMLATSDKRNMTATEVEQRHEEKMLQLGPTLERLQDELLDPLIDRTFSIMLRAGLIPEIPPELEGVEPRVEYVSILAQAQKLLGTVAVERLAQFGAQLTQFSEDVRDKINWDAVIDEYAELLGTSNELVRTQDEVAAIRSKRQQQMDAAAQAEGAQAFRNVAAGAKDLSQTQLENDAALDRLMRSVGGA